MIFFFFHKNIIVQLNKLFKPTKKIKTKHNNPELLLASELNN